MAGSDVKADGHCRPTYELKIFFFELRGAWTRSPVVMPILQSDPKYKKNNLPFCGAIENG